MPTITNKKAVEGVLLTVGDLLVDDVKQSLISQGHNLNGALLKSIVSRVKTFGDVYALQIFFNKYGIYLDRGVKASRVPFSNPTGRGGKSQYIEALTQYARRRFGISNLDEARSAAFAIAKKHKKEGMPTRRSQRFSSTGKRKFWFSSVTEKSTPAVRKILSDELAVLIDKEIINVVIRSI